MLFEGGILEAMRTSDSTNQIFPAYIKAQGEIGNLKKDSANDYFKSQYSSLEIVLETVKPIYLKHGIAILQGSGNGTANGINIITRLVHESGQWIETDFPIPLSRQDPQAAGTASSYGRRYALKAIASLAEIDDDAQASSEPDPRRDRSDDSMKQITDVQLKELNHLFDTLGAKPENIQATCRKYSGDRTECTDGLMKSEAQRMIGKLRIKLKEKAID